MKYSKILLAAAAALVLSGCYTMPPGPTASHGTRGYSGTIYPDSPYGGYDGLTEQEIIHGRRWPY